MNIADLFVNIAIKGKDEVSKGVNEVTGALGDAKSMSLEAKAAILTVIYGFEQMFAKSMDLGASLSGFSATTGIATKDLQQWRYAMEGAGFSADELQNNLGSVQRMLTNIKFGKAPPELMGLLQSLFPKEEFNLDKPMQFMQRFADLAKMKGLDPAVKDHILNSFGITGGTSAAMMFDAFNEKALKSAPVLSDAVLNANRRAKGQWSQMGTDAENVLANFNGKYGAKLVKDIRPIIKEIGELAGALVELADQLGIFTAVSEVFKILTATLKALEPKKPVKAIFDDIKRDSDGTFTGLMKSLYKNNEFLSNPEEFNRKLRALGEDAAKGDPQNVSAGSTTSTTVNVTQHNHGVKDAAESTNHLTKEIKKVGQTSAVNGRVK